jgi:hypothetical protein
VAEAPKVLNHDGQTARQTRPRRRRRTSARRAGRAQAHFGQSAAIGYMVNGDRKKICEAAEKAGLARESLSRALSTPHIAEYLRLQTVRRLGIAAARAGHTKVELLDSDSEIVRDRASSFVLGLAGIAPAATPSVNLNIEVKAGYVIDLSDDPPPMRMISP